MPMEILCSHFIDNETRAQKGQVTYGSNYPSSLNPGSDNSKTTFYAFLVC